MRPPFSWMASRTVSAGMTTGGENPVRCRQCLAKRKARELTLVKSDTHPNPQFLFAWHRLKSKSCPFPRPTQKTGILIRSSLPALSSFSLWTVHGPFLFLTGQKEKWGVRA